MQRCNVHSPRGCHVPGAQAFEATLRKQRVAGLFETPKITDYVLTAGYTTGRFTSRLDLASGMLQLLGDERYIREAVAVATVSVQPKLLQLLLKEAFPRRSTALTPEL